MLTSLKRSCAAIELDVADVQAQGMLYDRLFAFAEHITPPKSVTPVWTFRTLRQPLYEKLAHVKTEVWVPKDKAGGDISTLRRVEREGCLIVRYPNVPVGAFAWLDRFMLKWSLTPTTRSFTLPLNPLADHNYPKETVAVWNDSPEWLNMGKHLPADFAEWLGVTRPLTIFRADPIAHRSVFKKAPRKEEVGFQPAINFQDSFPLNILGITSVHDLGSKIDKDAISELSVRRFRPNIVIEGAPAYEEDKWKLCRIGGHQIFCSEPTTRCKVSAYYHTTDIN